MSDFDLKDLAEQAMKPGVGPGGKTLARHKFEAAASPKAVLELARERDEALAKADRYGTSMLEAQAERNRALRQERAMREQRDAALAQRDALGRTLRIARDRCVRPHTLGLGVTRQDADQLEREYQRDLAVIDKALADLDEGSDDAAPE